MQPQIMLSLILDDHDRRHRQAALEAMVQRDRHAVLQMLEGRRGGPERPGPRPPLGPLARLGAWSRRFVAA